MNRSYVGIITHRGLESFLLETDQALRLLVRRAYRKRPLQALCYWAILGDDDAREVEQRVRSGALHDAVRTLESSASSLGPILPPTPG